MVRNILITGGAGYIGSHITEILLKKHKKVYLIDNFLEQRANAENYYEPINRSNFDMIDLSEMKETHREFLFKQSIEISLSVAEKIFIQKMPPNNIDHPPFGILPIKSQMIEYPIIFE